MKFIFLLIILFKIGSAIGQFNQNALLWEIEKTDSTKTSYIFGTIHLIENANYFFPKTLDKSLNSIDRLYFEIDIEQSLGFDVMLAMMSRALLPDGITLKKLLNESDYEALEIELSKNGLPIALFDKIKPMFIQSLLGIDKSNTDGGFDGKSYEMELLKMAKDKSIEMGGLETADFQMSLFDSIPLEIQTQYLIEALNDSSSYGATDINKLTQLYVDQKIDSLYIMMTQDEGMIESFQDVLISKRNQSWIPRIEQAIFKESCLFAVGAGHLGGDIGIIQLMINKGYRLKPLLDKDAFK
jgi:hypothetical protein